MRYVEIELLLSIGPQLQDKCVMQLLAKGLNVLSVRRSFTTIKAIINLAIAEHGLDMRNPSPLYLHARG